jgi:hypothetical protein
MIPLNTIAKIENKILFKEISMINKKMPLQRLQLRIIQ